MATKQRKKKLSERDAWAAALAWREQLQGCVRLETDTADDVSPSIVPVFAWVVFVFNGSLADGLKEVKDTKATAASARAAAIAWTALSCCSGYGARENPHFWRRVFSELLAPSASKSRQAVAGKTHPYRTQRPISDAVRFFDGRNHEFPRVKIVAKFPQDSDCVRVWLTDSEVSADRKLQKLLAKFKPFMEPMLWSKRRIAVGVEGLHIEEIAKIAQSIDMPTGSTVEAPVFVLDTVVVRRQDTRYTAAIQDISTHSSAQIVVDDCEFSHLFHVRRGSVPSLLAATGATNQALFVVRSLSLARSIGSRSKFAVVCSALPHIRSITAVQLTSERMDMKALSPLEWAWLGYAIFHPDADDSFSFSRLDVQLPAESHLASFAIDILQRMAAGNNLLTALTRHASPSRNYVTARIGTYVVAELDSLNRDDLEVVLYPESRVTLCSSVSDVKKLDAKVQVVIPGYGLGWISSSSIAELVMRPSGLSCVRHLRLALPDLVDQDGQLDQAAKSALLDLLSVLGGNLLSLDIADSLPLNEDTVRSILQRCPLLRTFRVCHDGQIWSTPGGEDPSLPRLQELEISIDSILDPNVCLWPLRSASLSELTSFRLKTIQAESFLPTHKPFLTALATYPGIRYAHWLYAKGPEYSSYDKRRLHSLSLQRQYAVGHSDVSQVRMTVQAKVALESVARHESMASSAVSQLSTDILINVCSFSTSPVPRSVYIGNDNYYRSSY